MFFFFFKQKTAYEMRISDWSSDVCSSDLKKKEICHGDHPSDRPCRTSAGRGDARQFQGRGRAPAAHRGRTVPGRGELSVARPLYARPHGRPEILCRADRSEEHTSELQSLMRISYAVFCLKKKKQ